MIEAPVEIGSKVKVHYEIYNGVPLLDQDKKVAVESATVLGVKTGHKRFVIIGLGLKHVYEVPEADFYEGAYGCLRFDQPSESDGSDKASSPLDELINPYLGFLANKLRDRHNSLVV